MLTVGDNSIAQCAVGCLIPNQHYLITDTFSVKKVNDNHSLQFAQRKVPPKYYVKF